MGESEAHSEGIELYALYKKLVCMYVSRLQARHGVLQTTTDARQQNNTGPPGPLHYV